VRAVDRLPALPVRRVGQHDDPGLWKLVGQQLVDQACLLKADLAVKNRQVGMVVEQYGLHLYRICGVKKRRVIDQSGQDRA
jgi:hypothetical protein